MVSLDAATQNEFGQPVGASMNGWTPPVFPPHVTLTGRYCQLEPFQAARHAAEFWEALGDDHSGSRWTYLSVGPFKGQKEFIEWCHVAETSRDPQYYAIVVEGKAVGMIAYMHIQPEHGVIESGCVHFSPRLVRTRAATETLYLLLANAFALGYRRFEWKCDSCNLPSRAAASRLGFTYEGLFRQAIVYKGRTRDTTWFSIIDIDWNTGLKEAYERWLEPGNFDENGVQKLKFSALTAPFVHARS
ncbi:hypothetical protein Poli38472_004409 [Pythium oligandrum]|uniref:N-acetyltransferase domain-containing protein n=1 Tax=Pythium oligandrum TaxID=41045 RepID=A0A8K1FDE5_PYTOL|nr:hypothetical protein Poli38472_004409 [Pythium oligandrum]|eukprot:TMW59340.1 hypothetical protein Poli38472_004409 [Pythium oligandrum]